LENKNGAVSKSNREICLIFLLAFVFWKKVSTIQINIFFPK